VVLAIGLVMCGVGGGGGGGVWGGGGGGGTGVGCWLGEADICKFVPSKKKA
jgi:hypothetical protein